MYTLMLTFMPSKHYGNGPVMASDGLLSAITDAADDGPPPVSIRYWCTYGSRFLAKQLRATYGPVTGQLRHYASGPVISCDDHATIQLTIPPIPN